MQTSLNLNIFLDMDGVLVDLERGLHDQFGFSFPKEKIPVEEHEKNMKVLWKKVRDTPGFWENLPATTEWHDLYSAVLKHTPTPFILTASPHEYEESSPEHKEVADGKRQWVKKMFGQYQADRTLVTKSNLKQRYISPHINCILIDDMPANIERWNAAGGIGILHKTGDLKNTLDALEQKLNADI